MFRTSKLFVFLINFFFWRRLFNHLFVVNTIFFLWLWLLSLVCDCIIWYFTKVSWRQDSRAIWWLSIRGVWRRCQQPRLSHLESLCYFFIIIIGYFFATGLFTQAHFCTHLTQIWRIPCSLFDTDDYIPGSLCTIIALTRKKRIFKEILEL